MNRTTISISFLLAFLALVSAAFADSAEERSAYREAVEPICKTNKEASKKVLTGVEKMVKNDKLKPAGVRFTKAANALQKAQKQLALVPQPPGDAARLGKWLAGIKGEVSLMRRIAANFKAEDKSRGSTLVVKLKNNATKANNQVIVFQFNYCRIDPSSYR